MIYIMILNSIQTHEKEHGVSMYKEIKLERFHTPLDLKKKQKELFKQYHPDKQTEIEDKDQASQIFAKKTGVATFFQDQAKKNIYDKFGVNLGNDTRDTE